VSAVRDGDSEILCDLVRRHPSLDMCRDDLWSVARMLLCCFDGGGKLLLCGNGGSAADAEHIAGELLKGFLSRRPLSEELRARLGEEAASVLQMAFPAIPLTGFLALRTAFANDCRPEWVFAQLVLALGRPGDALLCISTSGNAENVLHAARTARALGLRVIGLTGRTGGALFGLCDLCLRVPADATHEVQELHLPLYHALCMLLEAAVDS
jgi:D-sedoheptulose 7-phosphate isomerase